MNKSYRVRVSLPADTPLMIGMTTELNIVVERRDDTTLVPETSVKDGALWIVEDRRAKPVTVTVGIRGNGKAEVTAASGALPDRVIAAPPPELQAGDRVRIEPTDGATGGAQ